MAAANSRTDRHTSMSVAELNSDSNQSNACIVAAGTTIQGTFSSSEPVRLDGTVEGDIECGSKLVVGINGKITGNVKAKNVIVKGRIEGDIEVQGHLHLFPTASISGNIQAQFFSMEEGAGFTGSSVVKGNL